MQCWKQHNDSSTAFRTNSPHLSVCITTSVRTCNDHIHPISPVVQKGHNLGGTLHCGRGEKSGYFLACKTFYCETPPPIHHVNGPTIVARPLLASARKFWWFCGKVSSLGGILSDRRPKYGTWITTMLQKCWSKGAKCWLRKIVCAWLQFRGNCLLEYSN